MPLLDDETPGAPSLHDRIIDTFEREAKVLADLGIGMLAEALKRRLEQGRARPAPVIPPERPAPQDTPYQTLGVAPSATNEEVEAAFREKVKACHPDRNGGGNDEELRQAVQAIRQIREERKL